MAAARVLFDLNNDAFHGVTLRKELPRMLRELADNIEHRELKSPLALMDVNGNQVGLFLYSPTNDIDLSKV